MDQRTKQLGVLQPPASAALDKSNQSDLVAAVSRYKGPSGSCGGCLSCHGTFHGRSTGAAAFEQSWSI